MAKDDDNLKNTVRGLRFDLVIAICALLISTLAAGAEWWQARVLLNSERHASLFHRQRDSAQDVLV